MAGAIRCSMHSSARWRRSLKFCRLSRNDQIQTQHPHGFALRRSGFGFHSSLVIRHSSFSTPQLLSMSLRTTRYDTLIIGAGPAGCATASILAEHGHRVLVLEREKFPRYHIGESLLPFT